MNPTTAYKTLFIISGLMFFIACGGIAFALFAGESLSTWSYAMISLTMVNAALFLTVGLNIKSKAEKEKSYR